MSQKGFVNILLIVLIVILAGTVGYLTLVNKSSQLTPIMTTTPTSTPKSSSTPTSSATTINTQTLPPTSTKKPYPQSLISITNTHLKAVRQTLPDAELFEISSFIPYKAKLVPENTIDLLIVKSHFVTPTDNVSFVEVSEEFQNWKQTRYSTSTKGFILGECYNGGAPPGPEILEAYKNCGKEAGKPEPRDKHLPIQNWKVDLDAIVQIVKENNIQTGDITVATAGRARNTPRGVTFQGSLLRQLPDDRTIILVVGREGIVENGISIADGRYIILNSENGTVLEKGTYRMNPLQP